MDESDDDLDDKVSVRSASDSLALLPGFLHYTDKTHSLWDWFWSYDLIHQGHFLCLVSDPCWVPLNSCIGQDSPEKQPVGVGGWVVCVGLRGVCVWCRDGEKFILRSWLTCLGRARPESPGQASRLGTPQELRVQSWVFRQKAFFLWGSLVFPLKPFDCLHEAHPCYSKSNLNVNHI